MDGIRPIRRSGARSPIWYLFPPAAAFLVVLLLFGICGLYPLGEKTLAWCDMRQQVAPLLLDLKNILKGEDSIPTRRIGIVSAKQRTADAHGIV